MDQADIAVIARQVAAYLKKKGMQAQVIKMPVLKRSQTLGKKTSQQIVVLLTEQSDKKRNLPKDFNSTVLLCGCFTAAGGIAPAGSDYHYDTFVGKVWRRLKDKGASCKISEMPEQARTGDDGNKSSVKSTEQGEYDAFKKEFKELQAKLQKQEKKLKSKDANLVIKELIPKLKQVRAITESKVLKEHYGLDPVR